jgi:hypothetical protein
VTETAAALDIFRNKSPVAPDILFSRPCVLTV